MRVFVDIEELEAAVGTHLGYSSWHTVSQQLIDSFAELTGDLQWIHVDTVRAERGPFGSTIAHGYLTLSLVPKLIWEVYRLDGIEMIVNYGADRLRFPTPVMPGDRLRAGVELVTLSSSDSGYRAVWRATVEREGSTKPACVVDIVNLLAEQRERPRLSGALQ